MCRSKELRMGLREELGLRLREELRLGLSEERSRSNWSKRWTRDEHWVGVITIRGPESQSSQNRKNDEGLNEK
jgi:hypothetical protein